MPSRSSGNDAASTAHGAAEAFLAQESFLRGVIRRRLQDSDAIDEVLQEVGLALSKAKPVPREALPAWLCRVAIRQALLFRRRQGRRQRLQHDYRNAALNTDPASADRDPLVWMLAEERRQLLHGALSRLSDKDREILTMKYVDGEDYHQIARRLKISHHAIANRLRSARDRLRREVETKTHNPSEDQDFRINNISDHMRSSP